MSNLGNTVLLADDINADGNVTLSDSIDNYRYIYVVGKTDGFNSSMPISIFKSIGKLPVILDGGASNRPKYASIAYIDTTHIRCDMAVQGGYYEALAIYGIK